MNRNTKDHLPGKSDDISLKDVIYNIQSWYKYLLLNWLMIFVLGISGGVLGFIYAALSKPKYIAETTFVLEESGPGGGLLGQYAGIASMVGVDIGGGGGGLFQGDNIIELYKSRSMVEKTLLSEVSNNGDKLLLIDRYINFNNLKASWDKDPELKGINFRKSGNGFSRLHDSLISRVVEDINNGVLAVGKPDKKSSIIKVEVKSPDEFFAKAFNDQIVKNVNDFYVQTKTKKALENLAILQQQTDSVRNVLNGAIYTTASIADATPNLNPTRQILRAGAQRSQFNAEANKAILTQLIQNLELAKLSLRKETPLIQVVDSPVFPLKKQIIRKKNAVLIGGILFGVLSIIILVIKRFYKNALLTD